MHIIEEGYLKGAVSGYGNKQTLFEFFNGGTWRQAEYKKLGHDAFMPFAMVKNIDGRCYLEIEGMQEGVLVIRSKKRN